MGEGLSPDVQSVGRVFYTVPWAIIYDGKQYWLRRDYSAHTTPGGTVTVAVRIKSPHAVTFWLLPGKHWTWEPDDMDHWQRLGQLIEATREAAGDE